MARVLGPPAEVDIVASTKSIPLVPAAEGCVEVTPIGDVRANRKGKEAIRHRRFSPRQRRSRPFGGGIVERSLVQGTRGHGTLAQPLDQSGEPTLAHLVIRVAMRDQRIAGRRESGIPPDFDFAGLGSLPRAEGSVEGAR